MNGVLVKEIDHSVLYISRYLQLGTRESISVGVGSRELLVKKRRCVLSVLGLAN